MEKDTLTIQPPTTTHKLESTSPKKAKDQHVLNQLGLHSTGNLFSEMEELLRTQEKDSVKVKLPHLIKSMLVDIKVSSVLMLLSHRSEKVIRLLCHAHLTMHMEEKDMFLLSAILKFHLILTLLLKLK